MIFFVAEIGINHNGDLEICKKLIDAAKTAGCDAVKFQKRDIDTVYTREFLESYRESPWGTTQRDQKSHLEFNLEQYQEIDKYCKSVGIEWFASAWDIKSQKFLRNFDCKFNKIASTMIVDLSFLEVVAEEGKHTFISTGMTTLDDIYKAQEIFKNANCSYELMHTVSNYPIKDTDANLSLITTLKRKFKCNVGYSGHEVGLAISYGAAALGITSLERHITLDRSMYGSDQSASIEPLGLIQLVKGVRKIDAALGDGVKTFSESEKKVAEKLRAHIKI